ncbi:reverse transcriptase domain-containing protein [Tanacetum coccineum]
MLRSRWSRDMTKYYRFHEDHGHNTNDCRELRHQINEAVKSGQFSYLVKGIKKGKSTQNEFLDYACWLLRRAFSAHGEVPLEITISNSPCLRTETLNFVIVRSNSLHNLLLGRKAPLRSTETSNFTPQEELAPYSQHINLTRSNVDVFAWTHADMMGVSRTIMVGGKPFNIEHKLNEYKHIKPVKQKKCWLGPNHRKVACKEVEELMKAGIILEVKNPTWVANPVMVKKADGGWRMILTKVLSRCLQRVPSDTNGGRRRRQDGLFHGRRNILLPKDSFRLEECRSYLLETSRQKGPFLGHLITKQGIRANPSKVKAVTDIKPPGTLKDVYSLNKKLAALSHFLSKGAEKSLPFFKELKSCTDKKTIQWTADAEEAFQKLKKFMDFLPTLTTLIEGEVLVMYLAASTKSISDVLLARREEGCSAKASKLYTDGASSFDGSGAGLMLISPEGKEYTYALCFKFKTTKNEAEYEALLAGLRIAQEMEIKSLTIFANSQLMVNQIKGSYEARQLTIKRYLEKVKEILKEVLVEVLEKRSINDKEVSKIEAEKGENWMTPIYEYLLSGLLPEDPKEARKIKIRAPQYKLIKGRLYKKSFLTPWPRCIGSTWPFNHWGINILGPLLMTPGNLKFLNIAIEHSTKWVEAKPLTMMNEIRAEKFAWEHVITQSFSPITKHVEIMNHIKKQLVRCHQGWTNDLARVLWVHRTLPRNSQNETPFTLTYDSEDIIPSAVSLIPEGKEHAIKEKAKREGCEER